MRDVAITLIIFGLLPVILSRPYVGILVWSWLGYMNPHRLAWGFSTTMPFAMMVALATFAAMIASKERHPLPWSRETVVLLVLVLWMFMTTVFSLYPWLAWPQWDKVWRIMLMTYVTLMLINDPQRLRLLVYVIALSLGFYGFKGGAFVLTGGSANSVLGPTGSFIEDRNSLGLAMIMTVPLLYFMRSQMVHAWVRAALLLGIVLTLIAIVGTHSRGALLGLAAMMLFFLLKSRQKFAAILAMIPLALVLLYVMPEEWFQRMETIEHWEEDESASERVRAWHNAIDLAQQRFIGGGMRALVLWGGRDSHSIYFGMLGEHGWVGLGLFLLLLGLTWRSASWIIRHAKREPELRWARDLAAMIQVSLIGYMVAGAFLGLQYFDMYYHLVVIVVMTKILVRRALEPEPEAPARPPALGRRTSVAARGGDG
ncbi:putative O-glycosylation ligase, exosortase A system-associated [Marichromatium bheemlicum]|uniref:O-glycosylation ligase, exosortase A system-associated n=1 Tax=Marichromatium bheemlicum TaxID=365339 RepID=A0ABX1I7Z6_9GAMM|nr:putative O-glycosylation ligase, exosortase A system-associated [Marichromatium bheemlicum]